MLTDSGYDVDTLIQQVSSPGGTTLAGLDALYEGKLEDTVKDACRRCTKRALSFPSKKKQRNRSDFRVVREACNNIQGQTGRSG